MARLKIGIITIISRNYGNRLQNLALQMYLKQKGAEVETIPIIRKYDFKWRIKVHLRILLHSIHKDPNLCWDRFNAAICWSKYIVKNNSSKLVAIYDYFVAGSDQIWNPLFQFNTDREFLTFAKSGQRVAYAGSIGLNEIPKNQETRFKTLLNGFSSISVRENAAAKIIQKLINRPVEVVVDPTLLIDSTEWARIADKGEKIITGDYILAYFLGDYSYEIKKYIDKQAKILNCRVFNLKDGHSGNEGVGPYEFLRLVRDSKCIFTDSYHGTIFSIIFHKPFLVFDRSCQEGYGQMNSRLDTLLDLPILEKHRIRGFMELDEIDYACSYNEIDKHLRLKRLASEKFLQRALNMEL